MLIVDAIIKLRDDLKIWATNNFNFLNNKINAKADLVDGKVPLEQLPDIQADASIEAHDQSPSAHQDLRSLINDLDAAKADKADIGTVDWSQNDPSAIGYIQNRTHWLDKSTNLILEEITVEANSWGGAELSEGILSPIVGDGRLYSITLDGVTYDCNSWMISYGEPRIGDSRLLEADSEKEEHPEDVPFLIDYYEEDLSGDSWLPDGPDEVPMRISSFITFATPGTHSIKIEEVLSYECHPLDEAFIPNTIARTSDVATKKDKDIIVTYRDGSSYYVTHSSEELYTAFQNGQTIYFQKNLELLNLLEINSDYATFYMYYVTQNGKPRQQVVAISGDSIIMELDDEYTYATATDLNKYALKTDIPTVTPSEAITNDEIDEIIGSAIKYAEDVMF